MSSHEQINTLTEREIDIALLIMAELSNQEIADKLNLTHGTVKWYASQIYAKIGVNNRAQAITRIGELDLAPPTHLKKLPKPAPRVEHLPTPLTSFVGREREIGEIKTILEDYQLVTLSGAGGAGKTRLALQVAQSLSSDYAHGVYFVPLAPISDASFISNAIASTLDIKETAHQSLLELIQDYLSDKHTLIILDNFEHVIAATSIVAHLLDSAPQLQILVTSREILNLSSEYNYAVNPLLLPDKQISNSLEFLQQNEAITLFIQRAQAVRPTFALNKHNMTAIAAICRRLDGLPLALELAAGRILLFSPDQLLQRLDSRLDILTGNFRDLPQRQQALRNTIDWSYDLLTDDERILFIRMAVFRDGCNLDAVEAICATDLSLGVIDLLESLLNKNLVYLVDGQDGTPRFMMLETIHEYAHEHLASTGQQSQLLHRHAKYFTALAEDSEQYYRHDLEQVAIQRLAVEHENLQVALNWTFENNQLELGLRLVAALGDFWYLADHYSQGIYWLDKALAGQDDIDPILRLRLLLSGNNTLFISQKYELGQARMRDAIELAEQLNDKFYLGAAMLGLALYSIGNVQDDTSGRILAENAVELFREINNPTMLAQSLNLMGELARTAGDYIQAQMYYEEALQLTLMTGDKRRENMMYQNLGFVAQYNGDYVQAEAYMRQFLSKAVLLVGYEAHAIVAGLALFAGPTTALGKTEKAVRIVGAAETQLKMMKATLHPGDIQQHERNIAQLIEQLGATEYAELWREGSYLSIEETLAYALSDGE